MKIESVSDNKWKFTRESWKEFFRVEATGAYISRGYVLPRVFVRTYDYCDRDVSVYYIFPLVPIVKLFRWLVRQWFKIPHMLFKAGHFEHREGEKIPWFWLKNIRINKIKK